LLNTANVALIAKILGAREVTIKGSKVRCNCLLAPWTHVSGRDSNPSMVILEGSHGDPIYACRSCHEKGSLRDLLCLYWTRTGRNMMSYIELLDGDVTRRVEGEKSVQFVHKKKRVVRISKDELDRLAVMKKIEDSGDDGKPWHDAEILKKSADVPVIPWSHYEPFVGSIPRYALDRGLTVDTCKAWELGHDKRMRRLLFPMRDRNQRLVAISGRRYACQWCGSYNTVKENRCVECRELEPEGIHACSKCGHPTGKEERCVGCRKPMSPKYLHSDGFQRNFMLYGESRIEDGNGLVYVVEGHLDALILWQCGYRPVVALLGSAPGMAQVEKLVAYYERILVVPDGDDAGKKMVSDLESMVAWRTPVMSRIPEKGKDPGSLGVDDLKKLLGIPPVTVAS